ncbi:hypothetical protein [Demequina sp. SO4-18]|uniref:hypothetical protein n=1 Tax=Demequina sp. SO4-18 TaxID=3401026 RepID=UPI003B5BEB68
MRFALDHLAESPNLTVAWKLAAGRVGFGADSLRRWVRQAQVHAGNRLGVSLSGSERIRALHRKKRSMCEANAILKDAGVQSSQWDSTPDKAGKAAFIDEQRATGRAVDPICNVASQQARVASHEHTESSRAARRRCAIAAARS